MVRYSEHTHYHLKKEKSDFPHIQGLTMQILVQMRGLLCGQRRIWRVRAIIETRAHVRVCVVENPRAYDKLPRKKF